MKNIIKSLSKGLVLVALLLVVGMGAGSANAALTLGALTLASDGALTLNSAATGNTILSGASTSGTITLGAALTSGTVTIGNATATGNFTIRGAQTTGTNSLFDNATTSAISIGALTNGDINIGTGNVAGVINIGNGASGSKDINIGKVGLSSIILDGALALNGVITLKDATSTLSSGVTNGTLLSAIQFAPMASATTATITRHQLVAFGDVTGSTAYGFGDPAVATYGVMASFGRTAAATGAFNGTDTSLDVRAINALNNSGGAYDMQGAYIKAKNYSGGTMRNLKGLAIEVANDGTLTGTSYGLKIADAGVTPITADIQLSSLAEVKTGALANPDSSNVTCAKEGSLYLSTNDGSLWRCTVAGVGAASTWVSGAAPSSNPYAMFYGTTTGTGSSGNDYAATVAAGAPVPFPRDGAASGIVRVPATTTQFTLPNNGTYEVTFNVGTSEPGQLQLAFFVGPSTYTAIDNTTAVGIGSTTGSPIGGTYFVTATAGQILTVINPAGNPAALTITPAGTLTHANSPSLTIKQL